MKDAGKATETRLRKLLESKLLMIVAGRSMPRLIIHVKMKPLISKQGRCSVVCCLAHFNSV